MGGYTVGTEIRTFYSLKEMNDSLSEQIDQYKTLSEDYSQWLGSLLRSCEENHGNEDWFQKSAALQKNVRVQGKKNTEMKQTAKSGKGKGKKAESSCWVQSSGIFLCSTEQGEVEILFEAIEEINAKIQGLERFKGAIQQLERLGLGKSVNYITYFKDDVPEKIVLRTKKDTQTAESFKFSTDLTVPGLYQ
jgi:hypothetical protein